MTSKLTENRGMALVLCLLIMTVLSAVGSSALLVSSTNQKIAGNYKKQAQAFNVAEAGIQLAIANIKYSVIWRGDNAASGTTTGSLGGGSYTVTVSDSTDDSNGVYSTLIPDHFVKLASNGSFAGSDQTIECYIELAPDDGAQANSPEAAVITTGPNTGSGQHVVNGYDNNGVLNPGYVLANQPSLPVVNQDALKAFADHSLSSLGNTEADGELGYMNSFFKDPPANTEPYITYVSGDMSISGSRTLYGIIFVEGNSVTLSGSVRVQGVIYAPNATVATEINGGGQPWDQPVMGQVISGIGGVKAAGNHADVQYVKDYVDAFNNFGGGIVEVNITSWKQS